MYLLPTITAADAQRLNADVALLPVGSFEQHGACLPLATDSLIAHIIATRLADAYGLLLLPPITISCSHEHEGLPGLAGTVSIRATTLSAVVTDIADSLERQGIQRLAIINGHGGNYVLSHVAQEASVSPSRRILLYPGSGAWDRARKAAGCDLAAHQDMHAGEGETSILLHALPELVGEGYRGADHRADIRPDLLLHGMRPYTNTGVIGEPSKASAEKGAALLREFERDFGDRLAELRKPTF
ncbi:creatinine amidohydrolase [Saccharopolyspora subtropica]|uniref:Creatinine amidohydrolase n=1 Tax=Saccharopolyspora thermophila TaxID=89367 RepID=A0A917JM17_9PSEU|nr:creatininase family protein [Saccharopolyspora subtropica]GGI76840.1 creatinine amidohydrolase [Saccharopolyspora subtropica]